MSAPAVQPVAVPSTRPYMGATPYPGGVTFRVWAPFATNVQVAGDFNTWTPSASPLAHENAGFWSADVNGATVGQRYKFVITPQAGSPLWKIDPYAKQVTNSAGDGVIASPDFDWGDKVFFAPGWDELVIYEIHAGTFNDHPGGAPGLYDSICEKMPYLRDLGVNAIQLLPLSEFPGGFSWGYNPSHIFAVESDYGGANGLKKLVKTAHEHGIAVILDVVYNHLGPSDLDLWRFDGWHIDDKGGIYFYSDDRIGTPWGPRPDYGRGEVRQYLRDNLLYWAEEFRFDGFRFDATSYIRMKHGDSGDLPDGWSLLQWMNDELQRHQPWKITIAEDMRANEWITNPTGAGGAGFDSQWDPDFVHPIRRVLTQPFDEHRDMNEVVRALAHRYDADALERVIYTESHDEVGATNAKQRLPSDIDGFNGESWYARKRSMLGAAMLFTAPGIPMLFQGQEFLERGPWHDDRPTDWSNFDRHQGVYRLYRDLIQLRRNWYNNTRGLRGQNLNIHHVNHGDKVLAYHRWAGGGPGDDVVVLCNLSSRSFGSYTIGVPRSGLWRVRFNSDSRAYGGDFGDFPAFDTSSVPEGRDGMAQSISIGLGPYSAVILSQ